jgi:hypothetical protein
MLGDSIPEWIAIDEPDDMEWVKIVGPLVLSWPVTGLIIVLGCGSFGASGISCVFKEIGRSGLVERKDLCGAYKPA